MSRSPIHLRAAHGGCAWPGSHERVGYWTGVPVSIVEPDESARGVRSMGLGAVLTARRALTSQTLTSRCRSARFGSRIAPTTEAFLL